MRLLPNLLQASTVTQRKGLLEMGGSSDLEAKIQYVKKVLEAWLNPFLLVFDNCDRPNALQAVKNHLLRSPMDAHLCTSRHSEADRLGRSFSIRLAERP